jgi:molybdenum cofactor guanylyltransferase
VAASRLRCTGVVLAGGQSTRYGGRPKGLESVGGVRIIDRVANALRATTDDLLLVANDSGASAWLPGVRVVGDVRPGEGSLGGIHAALVHAGTPVLVVAWDMPFVPAGLLAALRALGEAGFDVAVPEHGESPKLEPLCAYYGSASISAIERRLEAGERRVVAFYPDVRVTRLAAPMVASWGDAAQIFLNVNTAADLIRAAELAARARA